MKRLAQTVLLYSVLQSSTVLALGVGEISPESALNEPFRAYIPLKEIGNLDAAQIKVNLAGPEDFSRAGIEYTGFLSKLEFVVDIVPGGVSGIIVSTERQVTEPYLDFILEVRWPNGRVLREYTVLLDLPAYSEGPSSSVSAPILSPGESSIASSVSESEPGGSRGAVFRETPPTITENVSQPRPAEKQTALPPAPGTNEYRVQHNDTMWLLASRFRPSTSVTTEQTMLAMLNKNPEAFLNGNINQLKSGYVLRLPSENEAAAMEHQAAVSEISRQNKVWRGEIAAPKKAEPTSSATAPQVNATASANVEATAPVSDSGKFSISSAGDDAGSDSKALEAKLREQEEVLEKARLENDAMQGRVVEMEKQIATLQQLITLKNNELAALQSGAAKSNSNAAESSPAATEALQTASSAAESSVAETATETVTETATENASDAELASEVETALAKAEQANAIDTEPKPDAPKPDAQKPEVPKAASKPAITPTPEPTSPWYENELIRYVGAGVLLLLLVLLGLRRRAKSAEDAEGSLAPFDTTSSPSPVVIEKAAKTDVAQADDEDEDEAEGTVSQFDFAALDSVEGNDFNAVDQPSENTQQDISVEPQTSDVVGEAEIYIAYGNYDQAQNMLRNAISKDPGNTELRLKLIDTYLDTRDQENFKLAYAELKELGDDSAVAHVKESMSAIEGVSDWLSDDSQWTSSNSESSSLDDLDGALAKLDEASTPAQLDDLAFDLDEPINDSEEDDEEGEVSTFSFDDLDSDFEAALEESAAEDAQEEEDGFELGESGLGDFELGAKKDDDADALSLDELDADLDALDGLGSEAAAGKAAGADDLDLDLDALLNEGMDASTEERAEAGSDAAVDLGDLDFDIADLDKPASEPAAESDDFSDLSLDDLDAELSALDTQSSLEEAPSLASAEETTDQLDDLDDLDALLGVADADADGDINTIEASAMLSESEGLSDSTDGQIANRAGDEELSLEDLMFDEFDASDASSAESDLGMMADVDEVATKLDLARAYVDMGDSDGAREMLQEVVKEGNDSQRSDAQQLLDSLN